MFFIGTSYFLLSRGWGRDTKEDNNKTRYALLAWVVGGGGREGDTLKKTIKNNVVFYWYLLFFIERAVLGGGRHVKEKNNK